MKLISFETEEKWIRIKDYMEINGKYFCIRIRKYIYLNHAYDERIFSYLKYKYIYINVLHEQRTYIYIFLYK
jgi:hypothetical protein